MESLTCPAEQELPPEGVARWLRGPEGQAWLEKSHHRITRHDSGAGIFGGVIPEPAPRPARWPEAFLRDRL